MRRSRDLEPARPEPWNPEQWPAPVEPETATETEADEDGTSTTEPSAVDEPTVVLPVVVTQPAEQAWQVPTIEPGENDQAEQNDTERRRRKRRNSLLVGAGLGVSALALVAIIGLVDLTTADGSESATPAITSTVTSAPATTAPASTEAECPTGQSGKVTTGNDKGGQGSGPDVIKAFDWAYYMLRDAEAARAFATRTARVNTAEKMQPYIDSMAPRTRHCLKIIDEGTGTFLVELTETAPGGGEPAMFRQRVQTTFADGKHWIVAIEPL